jgi:hypothetical protein
MMAHFGAATRYPEPFQTGSITDTSNSIASAGQAFTDCSGLTGSSTIPIGQSVTGLRVNREVCILGQGGATDAANIPAPS